MKLPKVLIFDLDSTLTESKQPESPVMGELVARLLQKIPIAVMSGGNFVQFQNQLLPSLPHNSNLEHLYLFPTSASRCLIFKNEKWENLYDNSFSEEDKTKILEAFSAAMNETGFDNLPTEVWGERIEDRGSQITFSALGQLAPIEIKKEWDPNREKRKPLYESLVQKLPDFFVAMNATTSIDITKKGMTKAYGINQLSKILNIPVQDMIYVGDSLAPGGNDAVVLETGIPTIKTTDPTQTMEIIKSFLNENNN